MEFMLVLFEDPDLVATDEQRKEAVERVGEYAMGLLSDGTLKGGAPLHPVTEAKRIRTRDRERRGLGGAVARGEEGIARHLLLGPAAAQRLAAGWEQAGGYQVTVLRLCDGASGEGLAR